MIMANFLFTSESVTEGHPDKLCDQISDAVLDAILEQDKEARVACETCATTGIVMIMGEITSTADIDIEKVARNVITDIGYDSEEKTGFDGKTCKVMISLDHQSSDIALGVDKAYEAKEGSQNDDDETGAGDQGIMFGYACDETPELMPMAISLSHKLAKKLSAVRKSGELPYLRPDGKTQVTVEYKGENARDGEPYRIDTVVVSSQHSEDITLEQLRLDIIEKVVKTTIPNALLDEKTKYFINPTGRFVIGGPHGDSGLTGRKIIVDTYGGMARHGGGAFSGKDPTKVDRSATYAARHIAKNIVASGLAKRCEVQIAYAIGVAHPVSVMVDTFGTGKYSDSALSETVKKVFDLRPHAIIRNLKLTNPIYKNLAAYGHIGREDLDISWEKLDKVDELLEEIKLHI